jgi:hypothetical protein
LHSSLSPLGVRHHRLHLRRRQATLPNGVTRLQAWFNLQAAQWVESLAPLIVNGTDCATALK